MEIIKLEILNLASLDKSDGEVINFKEGALGNSNIFCIVGPTGSGKSTLLDAICLALYNRAPRYPRKNGEKQSIKIYSDKNDAEKNRLAPTDCRNILTRGTTKFRLHSTRFRFQPTENRPKNKPSGKTFRRLSDSTTSSS